MAVEVASESIEPEKTFRGFPRQSFVLRKILKQLSMAAALNPEAAHLNPVASGDRKSIRFVATRCQIVPDTPWRFTFCPCSWLLKASAQGDTTGRWKWVIRPPGNRVSLKDELAPLPEHGFWRLQLWKGDSYAASALPFTSLDIKVRPTRMGVFLDYEAGTLSVYNVTERSHIYTFTDTFTEKLWPLFYPGIRAGRRNAASLTIRPPTDWE